MFSAIVKDILSIAQFFLIPGFILLAKYVKGQTELKRDVKDIKKYVILLCENQKIPCVLEDK